MSMGSTMQVKMEYPFPPSKYVGEHEIDGFLEYVKANMENISGIHLIDVAALHNMKEDDKVALAMNIWHNIAMLYDYLRVMEIWGGIDCLEIGVGAMLDERMEGIR